MVVGAVFGASSRNLDAAQARSVRCRKLAAARTRMAALGLSTRETVAGNASRKDIRKQQRMLRNRESAALSRKRKSDRIEELQVQVENLEKENRKLQELVLCDASEKSEEVVGPPPAPLPTPTVAAPDFSAMYSASGIAPYDHVSKRLFVHNADERAYVDTVVWQRSHPSQEEWDQRQTQPQEAPEQYYQPLPNQPAVFPTVATPTVTVACPQVEGCRASYRGQQNSMVHSHPLPQALSSQSSSDQAFTDRVSSSSGWMSGYGGETEGSSDRDGRSSSCQSEGDFRSSSNHSSDSDLKFSPLSGDTGIKTSPQKSDATFDYLVTELMKGDLVVEQPGTETAASAEGKARDLMLFLEGLGVVQAPTAGNVQHL